MGFFIRLGQCSFGLKSKVKILALSRSVSALPSAFRGAWTQPVTRSFKEITTWSWTEKRKVEGQVVWVFLPLPHEGEGGSLRSSGNGSQEHGLQGTHLFPFPAQPPCTAFCLQMMLHNDLGFAELLDLVNLAGRYRPSRQPLCAISCASIPVSALSLKRTISAVHQHYYSKSTFLFFWLPKYNLGDPSAQENDLNIA